ncbi:hypothetical protein [Microbispora sp. H10836]|uniref:hypothetical protein n=1 Tax=Microbispora sp. H10836 TaxID=2729106 RepID=UPI0014750EFA|nr:hypothetical protein [Microbispora sp. H10836]
MVNQSARTLVQHPRLVAQPQHRGLRHLADRLDDDLVAGIVLHTGAALPFGPRLHTMPVSAPPGVTPGST